MPSLAFLIGDVGGYFALVAACLWLFIKGLRTGIVKVKRSHARTSEPKFYWVVMMIYGAWPALVVGIVAWELCRAAIRLVVP